MFNAMMIFLGRLGNSLLMIILAALLLCIVPALLLWAVNTVSEQSGSNFYIPHNFWTYLSIIVLWMFVSPSNITKKDK